MMHKIIPCENLKTFSSIFMSFEHLRRKLTNSINLLLASSSSLAYTALDKYFCVPDVFL